MPSVAARFETRPSPPRHGIQLVVVLTPFGCFSFSFFTENLSIVL